MYFHVVTDGSIGSLTSTQISDQMTVLNDNYGGSRTGFNFTLAGVTRTDNAAWFYAGPGGTDEHSMKQALHQGGDNALNLYSTTAGPYLGWAYLPDITTKPGQAYLDGIVIDWESMPGTSTTYAGRYDEGKTVTHETGHWLEPRAHVLRRVQREGRLRRRHTGGEDADLGLPDRQGHLLRTGARPDPQLHGLLVRQLLHGVHCRPGAAHARRLVALPRVLGSFLQGGAPRHPALVTLARVGWTAGGRAYRPSRRANSRLARREGWSATGRSA